MTHKYIVRPCGLIIKDEKILLVRSEYHGDTFFVLPGGKLEDNESLKECVEREILEETNLVANTKRVLYIRDFITDKEHVVDVFFLMELKSKNEVTNEKDPSNSGVIKSLEWVSLEDLNTIKVYPKFIRTKLLADFKEGFTSNDVYVEKLD